jgi:hypothetical protein
VAVAEVVVDDGVELEPHAATHDATYGSYRHEAHGS